MAVNIWTKSVLDDTLNANSDAAIHNEPQDCHDDPQKCEEDPILPQSGERVFP